MTTDNRSQFERKTRERKAPPQMVPDPLPGEPDLVNVDTTWCGEGACGEHARPRVAGQIATLGPKVMRALSGAAVQHAWDCSSLLLGGRYDVDADGGAWLAFYAGGSVGRYTPDGVLDAVVEVPVSKVTACTFGGPHLDQLFITTSREHLPPEAEPSGGALFMAVAGVSGRPVREFAG